MMTAEDVTPLAAEIRAAGDLSQHPGLVLRLVHLLLLFQTDAPIPS